jgi:uncharacterized membrane protein
MKQPRYKSKVLWAAVAAEVVLLLQMFGVFNRLGLSMDTVQQAITGLLGILVGFGILNDPTSKSSF